MMNVLVLCSHEPERDPRIDWIARYAPAGIACTVVGFHDPSRPRSALEDAGKYSIVRLAPSQEHWFKDLIFVGRALIRHANVMSKLKFTLALAIALPLSALFPFLAVIVALFRRIVRRLRLLVGAGSPMEAGTVANWIWNSPLRRWWRSLLDHRSIRRFDRFCEMVKHVNRVSAALLRYADTAPPFDLVHSNDFDTLVAGVALKIAERCRLVYDAHEYWPYSDVAATRFEQVLWARAERLFVRFADAAFTVSAPLAQTMELAYGRTFGVLPNCEPNVAGSQLAGRQKSDLPLSVVYLGTFAPERGIEEVVRAWKSVAIGEAALYLYGPDNECKTICMEIAKANGTLGRTVHFPEAVHETELVSVASRYDVGLIPYKPITIPYRFCCPNKLSQYMQAGLAILTNDLPNVVNIVHHYDCGIVYDSSQPDTLANAVRGLANEPGRLVGLKQRSAKAALTDFNWRIQSRALYAAYTGEVL